jgi:hypothetical protein
MYAGLLVFGKDPFCGGVEIQVTIDLQHHRLIVYGRSCNQSFLSIDTFNWDTYEAARIRGDKWWCVGRWKDDDSVFLMCPSSLLHTEATPLHPYHTKRILDAESDPLGHISRLSALEEARTATIPDNVVIDE